MANISNKNVLFGVQKQQLKHLSKKEYLALKELSRLSKNMYNVAVYNIRQYYFKERKFLTLVMQILNLVFHYRIINVIRPINGNKKVYTNPLYLDSFLKKLCRQF